MGRPLNIDSVPLSLIGGQSTAIIHASIDARLVRAFKQRALVERRPMREILALAIAAFLKRKPQRPRTMNKRKER